MPKNLTVVFDLDDTLYYEADYVASGVKAVCDNIKQKFGITLDDFYGSNFWQGHSDWLGLLCDRAKLNHSTKPHLLNVYRSHEPNISLAESSKLAIEQIRSFAHVAILTDGRSLTQRLKVKSLGLEALPLYISEDYSSEKPDALRFEKIMQDLHSHRFTYIGDNPKKDFITPNQLGWQTIGILNNGRNIHTQDLAKLNPDQLPKIWVPTVADALPHLC